MLNRDTLAFAQFGSVGESARCTIIGSVTVLQACYPMHYQKAGSLEKLELELYCKCNEEIIMAYCPKLPRVQKLSSFMFLNFTCIISWEYPHTIKWSLYH